MVRSVKNLCFFYSPHIDLTCKLPKKLQSGYASYTMVEIGQRGTPLALRPFPLALTAKKGGEKQTDSMQWFPNVCIRDHYCMVVSQKATLANGWDSEKGTFFSKIRQKLIL